MEQPALISVAREQFHRELLERVLTKDRAGVPSNADKDNSVSISIAKEISESLGLVKTTKRLAGQSSGRIFEIACQRFIESTFPELTRLRPGQWSVIRGGVGITGFEQYHHLGELDNITKQNALLKSTLGSDYIIKPDIVIGREPESDEVINQESYLVDRMNALYSGLRAANNEFPILHASISCKWTMRSDRAQNTRSEALNLIRNRKGRLAHIAVVTAEPLPSRLASIALGTGDVDCVYHFALPELQRAVQGQNLPDSKEMLQIMIEGKRLRDISDLPLDLAI